MSARKSRVRFAELPQNVELSDYDVLKEQYADKKAENQSLKQRIETLQSEFDAFKLVVGEDNPDLSKDKIALLQDLNQTKRDLTACQRQISRLEETIAASRTEPDASARGSPFRDVSAKQTKEMRDLADQYDRLQVETLELQLTIQKLQESKAAESAKLEASEIEKSELSTKYQNLEVLHAKLTRRASEMQTDRQKFTATQTENERLRDKIADLQTELDLQRANAQEQKAELDRLTEENHKLVETLDSVDIADKVRTIKRLSAQLQDQQDLVASQEQLRQEVAKLTGRVLAAEDRNTSLRMQIRTIEAEREDLRQERDRAIGQLQFHERNAARSPKPPAEIAAGDKDRLLEELVQSRRNNDYLVSKLKVLQRGQLAEENSALRRINQALEEKLSALSPEALQEVRAAGRAPRSAGRSLTPTTRRQERRPLVEVEGENDQLNSSLDHSQRIVSEMLGAQDEASSVASIDSLDEKLGRAVPQMLETVRGLQDSAKKHRNGELGSDLQRVSRTLKQLSPSKHSFH